MNNQKGFTLVELLIGMVILSIVTAALTGFIVSSSKSYAASNTEIVVQQESQLAMNQISDVVIDTTRSVNYVGYSADGSVSEQAVKDADFTIDVEDKSLTLYNGEGKVKVDASGNPVLDADGNPEIEKLVDEAGNPVLNADGTPKLDITGGNGNKNYQIYWDKSEEKLFYTEIEIYDTEFPVSDRVVLAEFVKDFSVDLSQVEEKRVVSITIQYEYNNRLYETSNNITIRNKVLVNNVNLAVNRSVELNIRPKENMVILEPGEDYYKFSTPVIDGRNVIDKSVTWSISPEEQSKLTGPDTGFTDPDNGIIHISSAETANSFIVEVMTNATDSEGNHATAEVIVYVKRVKNVCLSKTDSDAENGPTEISAGSDIVIKASVTGTQLGYTCSNCGDDTAIDKYVVENENAYKWNLIDPNNICTMNSSDHGQAEFSISAAAQPGQQIIIEATSLLSVQTNQKTRADGSAYGRKYTKVSSGDALAPETGRIVLTVANHDRDISLDGNFKYGDEPLTLNWTYPHAYGLVCVRIKTDDENAPMANDKVMIFNTDGYAIRVGADLFGLDLNHDYYISMQVLDYQLDKNAADYETKKAALVAEYNGHLDATGTYIGSIHSSSKLTVPLLKPQITIHYNGKDYMGDEINMAPISALKSYVDISCGATDVSSTRGGAERVKNDVKANLYLGNGDALYYFDENTKQYVDTTGTGGVGALKFNDCSIHKGDTLKVKLDSNGNAIDAVGSYHYTPFFSYSNKADAARFVVHYSNYTPDYDLHYYYRPESNINFTIVAGGNMSLWANSYGNFYNGEIYFPTPSDSDFRTYFTLYNTAWQTVTPYNYFKLRKEDGGIQGLEFSKMKCRYIQTEDSYEIELFYKCKDSLWDCDVEVSAGTFKCSATGTEWIRLSAGELDDQLNRGNTKVMRNGNASVKIGDSNDLSEIYIPFPTDAKFTNNWYGNFGFDVNELKANPEKEYHSSNDGISIKYRNGVDGNGLPTSSDLSCVKENVFCTYDGKGTYTLRIVFYLPGSDWKTTFERTFTYTEGDSKWKTVE